MSIHRTLTRLFASCSSSLCLSLIQNPAQESGSICSFLYQHSTKSNSFPPHQKGRQFHSQDSDILTATPGNTNFALQQKLALRGDQELAVAWATAEVLALPLVHAAEPVFQWQRWECTKSSVSLPSKPLPFSSSIFSSNYKRGQKGLLDLE